MAQPRRLALLAYLSIAHPHGFHRRDSILCLFWPERNAEGARAALNRSLYFLRRELGDGVVLSRGDEEVGIDRGLTWCDAVAFRDAMAERRYREALELYHGELLPGFYISEAPAFERWLEGERARYRDAASEAAWALAELEEAAGDRTAAAHWARRGMELAPLCEVAFRRLVGLLTRSGDRAGALQAYAKFTEDLRHELDVAPAPETQFLLEAIRAKQAQATPGGSTGGPPPNPRPNDAGSLSPSTLQPEAAPPPARPQRLRRPRQLRASAVVVLSTLGVSLLPARMEPINPVRVDVAPLRNGPGDRFLDRLGRLAAQRLIEVINQAGLVQRVGLLKRTAGSRAGTVINSAVSREDGRLVLRVWVTDVRRGANAWAINPVAAPSGSVDQAVASVRSRLLGAIAVLRNPSQASLLPVASPPPVFDAYQEFEEGLKLHAQGWIARAILHYRWAMAIDSTFTWPLVYGAMRSLYSPVADLTPQVDSMLNTLTPLRDRLAPIQRHLVNHLLAVRAEDWEASYRSIRAAAELAPDAYSLMLASQANHLNRPREAVATLTRLRMDSLYRDNIGGYWYVLTGTLHHLGEHRAELQQARRARHYRPASIQALFQEIRALAALGRLAAVRVRLDTLLILPREGWFTQGAAITMVAAELRAHDLKEAASNAYQLALAWYRSRPAEERASQEWRELVGELLYAAQQWTDADTLFQALAREYQTSVGYPDNVAYLGRIGMIAARLGDVSLAGTMAARLKVMDRAQPIPGQEAIVFRARIAALLGQQEESLRLLVEAYGPTGTLELHHDIDFASLISYPPFQEFLRPKG
ncbi:MAG: BTAD domain-containing putative transcriptional regulator [Gemmatimonadales bacterium]